MKTKPAETAAKNTALFTLLMDTYAPNSPALENMVALIKVTINPAHSNEHTIEFVKNGGLLKVMTHFMLANQTIRLAVLDVAPLFNGTEACISSVLVGKERAVFLQWVQDNLLVETGYTIAA